MRRFRWLGLLVSLLGILTPTATEASGALTCSKRDTRLVSQNPGPLFSTREFTLSSTERWWRGAGLKLEIIDQPDRIFETEIVSESPRIDRIRSFPNPEESQIKLQITLDPGKWALSQDEIKATLSAVKGAADPKGAPVAASNAFKYFYQSRGTDKALRFLSAFNFEGGFVENLRPLRVDMNSPADPDEDEWQGTFSVKFDPMTFLFRGTRLKKALENLNLYSEIYGQPVTIPARFERGASETQSEYLKRITGSGGAARLKAALLPVFKVERVDQFDFVQSGNRFFPVGSVEDDIETYTITWDLSRAFSAKAERSQVPSTLKLIEKIKTRNKQLLSTPEISLRLPSISKATVGDLVYIPFRAKGGVPAHKWCWAAQNANQCFKPSKTANSPVPGLELSGNLLHGYPTRPGKYEFVVRLADANKRVDEVTCELEIKN